MTPRDALAATLLLTGVSLMLVGTIGLHRFPDVFARMHAAAKPATLGLVLTLLGTAVRMTSASAVTLLALAIALQFLTTPAGAQMLGRAAYRSGTELDPATSVDELADAPPLPADADPPPADRAPAARAPADVAGRAPAGREAGGGVCALVGDLMDRSRLAAAVPAVAFLDAPEACAGAAVVVVELTGHGHAVGAVRAAAPGARIVAFGPHVDEAALAAARAAGADVVLPRSRFFRDPAAAVHGAGDGPPTGSAGDT